jgi:ComF family protein
MGAYREPLRESVLGMKYRHRWPVVEILADRMLGLARVRALLDETDVLVPVPLHWSRQILRGYNQADCLARRLAKYRRGMRVAYPIVRLKNTASQTVVRSIADRDVNLRFAFGLVDRKCVEGKRVTLVDDVITTAATLKAAARAMDEAGLVEVNGLVIAVADPQRRDFQVV